MESLHLAIRGRNVGKRQSAGTEAVVIEWTAKPNEALEYWADGTEADDEAEGPENVLIATLDLMTLALGIRLPEEVALGPLATVSLEADR